LVPQTKTGKICIPYDHNMYQMAIRYTKCQSNIPNGHKNTNIFHSKAVQKLTRIGIFGLKIFHLATLVGTRIADFGN
jgi:hypothetical protein